MGEASIQTLDVQLDSKGNYCIPIWYNFLVGTGDSISENSVLVKPFNKILLEGKPIGKTTFMFYRENDNYFVIGSFAFTHNTSRVMFFPGVAGSRLIRAASGRKPTDEGSHNLDHITLEPDLNSCHVTLSQKRNEGIRYSRWSTTRVLWLVVGISSVNSLEPMPKTQKYTLQCHSKHDLLRRKKNIMKSVEGRQFAVMDLDYDIPPPCFINLEFFATNKKSTKVHLPAMVFPIPEHHSKLLSKDDIRFRILDDFFAPEDSVSILVRASKIRGSLNEDVFFYSYGSELTY